MVAVGDANLSKGVAVVEAAVIPSAVVAEWVAEGEVVKAVVDAVEIKIGF